MASSPGTPGCEYQAALVSLVERVSLAQSKKGKNADAVRPAPIARHFRRSHPCRKEMVSSTSVDAMAPPFLSGPD